MAALLGSSSIIRTSVIDDFLDIKTNAAHQHEEASDFSGNNDGSSAAVLTQPRVGKAKVANTTPKMSILFNQLEDINIGYFGYFEFVDSQRSHHETFDNDPTVFPVNPTKQDKTIAEKELYAFSELCISDVFIHIIRIFYVGTYNVDDSRITQKVCQEITNLKQEWK